MAHREDIRAYLEGLTVSGLAIDWGSGTKPVKKYVKGTAVFRTIDKNPSVTPDKLHDIKLPIVIDQKADHAFCMEVLEHTTDPGAVLKNIYSNLNTGGTLHLSVPFLYPEHGEDDYLRFTSIGLRYFVEAAGFRNVGIRDITDGFILEAIK